MSTKCKSCGAQSNAANQLSFVCEFCGTKNVDEQYLKNLAIQKATAEANSKSFQLGLISVQGNDIAAAEKQFEAAVSEDPNNPDAWIYLAYCKAALVKPSNYEKNIGVAKQAIQKAMSIDGEAEVVTNGVVLVGGKFLQASVGAATYYFDTALKKYLAYGENASARQVAASEASLGLNVLRDAIQMSGSNLELIAVSATFAFAKAFELKKAIGNDATLTEFQTEFGHVMVKAHQQRPELIDQELSKYDKKLDKEFRRLLPKSDAPTERNDSDSGASGVNKKMLMIGGGGVLLVIILAAALGGGGKDKPSAPVAAPAAPAAAPAAAPPVQTQSDAPAQTETSAASDHLTESVRVTEVVAPAEAKPLLTAMLTHSSSSFRLAELKTQVEALPKPQQGDRKVARKLNEQGLSALRSDKFDDAVNLLRQAVDADPSDVEVKNNYVYALIKSGKVGSAETMAGDLLMNSPGRSSAWANLAEIYALKGKEEEAARSLVIAFQFSSNKDKTLTFLREKASDDASVLKSSSIKALSMIEKM